MPSERDHHLSKDNTFEIVVIPRGDTGSTRSYTASVLTISLAGIAVVILIASLTIASIVYTPAGLLLPMSEEQLQKRYGSELFEVQKRLNTLSSEVLVLREYNNKLRSALGQKEIPADSTFNFAIVDVPKDLPVGMEDEPQPEREQVLSNGSTDRRPSVTYLPASAKKEEATFRAEFPIIAPATGFVSRRFESDKGHNGIDYAGKIGSLIVAAADGYVIFSGYSADDGHLLILSHGGGYLTIYKHNQTVLKSAGDFVKRGEPIALLGNSGRTSFGPHLHFEIWSNGKAQNPNDYLIASEL